jgi:methyl-accepting chemotaxis protein
MRIVAKFNIILISIMLLALVGAAFISYSMLHKNAEREVISHAGMMLQAALAIRSYTVGEIRPLLQDQMKYKFLPQSVPAYAATQSFTKLRENYPDYTYKEATINPTNPRNRAVDWENDIIRAFRNDADRTELIGVRNTPTGQALYLSRPIRVSKQSCLTCHGHVNAAPETMINLYGSNNGFGWNMNEVVGAQIVSVPMSVPSHNADVAFVQFMGMLLGIFALMIVLLNIMLRRIIIKPIIMMAKQANEISMGNMSSAEFTESSKDELSILGASFNRMRRSLQKAMRMLEEKGPRPH